MPTFCHSMHLIWRLESIKFIYFEKATKFCEISAVVTGTTYDKSTVEICKIFGFLRIYELSEKETSDILRRLNFFEKISHFVLTLQSNFKTWLDIFFLFLWPSQNISTLMTFSCFVTNAFFINNNIELLRIV